MVWVLVTGLGLGVPPPPEPAAAALKKSHVSPGANLTPFAPVGSGTCPPPLAIQVTAAREQEYTVLIWFCWPAEGSGAFLEAHPLVCSHLSRSCLPMAMGSTLSAAPCMPRYATGEAPPEQPDSWAPAMTATALKTSVVERGVSFDSCILSFSSSPPPSFSRFFFLSFFTFSLHFLKRE